jgi:hypothetical protein
MNSTIANNNMKPNEVNCNNRNSSVIVVIETALSGFDVTTIPVHVHIHRREYHLHTLNKLQPLKPRSHAAVCAHDFGVVSAAAHAYTTFMASWFKRLHANDIFTPMYKDGCDIKSRLLLMYSC